MTRLVKILSLAVVLIPLGSCCFGSYVKCSPCHGTGKCQKCKGTGYLSTPPLWTKWEGSEDCYICRGSGKCKNCDGAGEECDGVSIGE
jgi:hypothetical protein